MYLVYLLICKEIEKLLDCADARLYARVKLNINWQLFQWLLTLNIKLDSSFFDELQQLLQGVYVADVILFIV